MEFTDITYGFEAMRWIVTTVIGVYAWLIGRQSAKAQEMLELRTRLTKLEIEMRQVPTVDQIHEVATKLERLDARITGISESMQPIGRSLERINDFLLKTK